MNPGEGHSAAYFGDSRDHWYTPEFVELVARRWKLRECRSLLDVGSGVGHWTRLLLPRLSAGAKVVGVEREPRWVREAARRTPGVTFVEGDATSLPFPDASFDLVTCQTVLIHVADVRLVLREMVRVLAPGGLLAVAEPNNLMTSLSFGSATHGMPIDDVVDLVRLHVTCERGKAALGEGNDSVGDLLPGEFQTAGLTDIQTYLSDKPEACLPPYAAPSEAAYVEDSCALAAKNFWIWDHADTERYFRAGGGAPEAFEKLWQVAMRKVERQAEAMCAKTWHEGGARVMYLVSGRKVGPA